MSQETLATQIELWPIDRFVPYARNPRKNDHAVDRMVASIREFGFKIPILARSNGEVVDGHLRLKAAHRSGISRFRSFYVTNGLRLRSRRFG
jgi:ParB-like chromosome segregation protein Spo0J